MKWILDDMVFNDLACEVPPSDLAGWPDVVGLMLADETAKATDRDGSGRRQALLAVKSPATTATVIKSFSVTSDSEAWSILYDHLRTGPGSTKNLAEDQSIAWGVDSYGG